MNEERFNVGYEFDRAEVKRRIDETLAQDAAGYICVVDGNILQRVRRDEAYRQVVASSMFSICDSSWVPIFLKRIYGEKREQYCGSQIFDDFTRAACYRQLFLGTSQQTLDALKANMAQVDPKIADMCFMPLPFRAVEDFDYPAIAEMVNADGADVIWVALGAPKQEQFMNRLLPYLKRGVMIGVGAVFNFRSGLGEKRAPQWMIRSHLEWLYRIFLSPRKQLSRCWQILTAYPAIYMDERRKALKKS